MRKTRTPKLSRAAIQHLIELSPAVHYTANASGDYGATFVSEGVMAQLGYEPTQFTQDSGFWISRTHPDDRSRVLAELEMLFTSGRGVIEYRFQSADGHWHWMRDDVALIRDANGKPLEFLGSWLDITGRKEAEEALREAQ